MKRLFNLFAMAVLTAFSAASLFAQAADEPLDGKEKMREMLKGLSLGLEVGAHEYPLAVWYPAQSEDGYSIRSLYAKPYAVYQHSIQNFDVFFELDFTADLWAPSPAVGATAYNAKDADRANWFFLYFEEEFAYRFPIEKAPGTLSVFLNHQNNFYITPKFPAAGEARPIDGKTFDGRLTAGPAYKQDFAAGEFHAKLGVPLDYLSRYSDDLGLGLELTLGYKGDRVKIAFDATPKMSFLPAVEYAGTEFELSYSWYDLKATVNVDALKAFDDITITPKVVYTVEHFSYEMGLEFGTLMTNWTFSPSVGFAWYY
ncbi:MAG: hypothetical protein LBB82_07850 [Treponema sp.]|nr:hypothetical protein [Treponema sp.]